MLRKLLDHARARRVPLPPVLNTPYVNTIALAEQPQFPGQPRDRAAHARRSCAGTRWRWWCAPTSAHAELGGHIASYASAADLFEVGFNHFFRARAAHGDLVFFQPHSRAGRVCARVPRRAADRRTPRALPAGDRAARALSLVSASVADAGRSGSSRPARWASGRSTRSTRRASCATSSTAACSRRDGRKVWAFVGDGEMDEPESLAGLSLAAREDLDNLIFVVNCNLQRLDGPVRGNGSIIAGARGPVRRRRLERDQAAVGLATGIRCSRATHDGVLLQAPARDGRRRVPDLRRHRRRASTASTSSTSTRSCSSSSRAVATTTSTACAAAATTR